MRVILLMMLGLSILHAEFIRQDTNASVGSVVLDTTTNLMWQDDNDAKTVTKNWSDALAYCEAKTLGGYSDWRLPNFNELYFLADRSKYNPALSSIFANVVNNYYWSSTTVNSSTSNAWRVNFRDGNDYWRTKSGTYDVRCVR